MATRTCTRSPDLKALEHDLSLVAYSHAHVCDTPPVPNSSGHGSGSVLLSSGWLECYYGRDINKVPNYAVLEWYDAKQSVYVYLRGHVTSAAQWRQLLAERLEWVARLSPSS